MNLRPGRLLNCFVTYRSFRTDGVRNFGPDVDRTGCASESQEAKRMGSALVSAGLVELALFTMT